VTGTFAVRGAARLRRNRGASHTTVSLTEWEEPPGATPQMDSAESFIEIPEEDLSDLSEPELFERWEYALTNGANPDELVEYLTPQDVGRPAPARSFELVGAKTTVRPVTCHANVHSGCATRGGRRQRCCRPK
jgi:hypothetical protein